MLGEMFATMLKSGTRPGTVHTPCWPVDASPLEIATNPPAVPSGSSMKYSKILQCRRPCHQSRAARNG